MNIAIHSHFVWRAGFILALVFLTLAVPGRASAQASAQCANQGVGNSTTGSITWAPQWCQEFNSTVAGPPDTTVWQFDLGNGTNGWGNNEVEVYCGPPGYSNGTMSNPPQCANSFLPSTSNAYLDGGGANGHLVIQAINNGAWTSARMKTQGTQIFLFGRFEASIQLPDTTNQGLWPAFWSLGNSITTGTPWPNCGEADFMEVWSPQVLNGPGTGGNRATIHTAVTAGAGSGGSYTFPSGMANTAFHTYGVIWSANIMQFYVDSATQPFLIKTPSDLPSGDTWPFNAPIFLLMNVAVGGTLGGTPSISTPNPGIMSVDYVRLYAPSTVPKPTLGNPPSITVKAGVTTGNSSTFNPGLTPGTGFAYFTCSTTAPKSTCAIATSNTLNTHVVNSGATTAETVTVTVTTTANAITPPLFFTPENRIWLPVALAALLALIGLKLARSTRRRAWRYGFALLAICVVAGTWIAGCSGGSSSPPPPANGTPPGSYTVTVYAFTESNIGDGSNANADASVNIPLTVN